MKIILVKRKSYNLHRISMFITYDSIQARRFSTEEEKEAAIKVSNGLNYIELFCYVSNRIFKLYEIRVNFLFKKKFIFILIVDV